MNYSKLELQVCRICLANQTTFNWNEEIFEFSGVSYKDCYYKYTEMEQTDADFYPTNLCGKCADEVKNAHTLFEKALKSFIILQNMAESEGYESLDSCNGSQKLVNKSYTFNEYNITEIHRDETIAIDEVICYSPINDDMIETGNAINDCKETSIIQDKSKHSFEPPFRIPLEKQVMDCLDIKLLRTPIDNTEKNKRKILGSLNTALKLKLRLEICGSKLFKSTTKPSATKTSKHLPQATEKVQSDATAERNLYSDHSLSTKSLLENTKIQQSPSKKRYDNDEIRKSEILENPNVGEHNTNFIETFCPKRTKRRELQTPIISKISGKEKKSYKLADNSLPNENRTENYMSSASSLNTNSSISNESQTFSLTDKSIETKKKTFKPEEISLLEKIYGKHFDIESVKINHKTKKPSVKICQYCSARILGKCHLLAHEATHLEHRERNMICPKCGIRLYTKLALTEHIKTHDENRQKQHKCEFCEKAFFHKGALNVHRRIHLGLMVKCPVCAREFYRKIDLERHLTTHSASPLQNSGSVQKKYIVQCQYCNKSIRTSSWRAHKAAHLKEPQTKCKICNKDFYSRTSCVEHLHGVHRKSAGEYEENIHYYVDCTRRMSHLMIKQQETVLPLKK